MVALAPSGVIGFLPRYLQIIQKHIQDRQDKHVLRNAQRKDLSCTCTFVCVSVKNVL